MHIKRSLKRHKYAFIVGCYLMICILIIFLAVQKAKIMFKEYNANQSDMVTGLLVANTNAELDNLVDQLERISYMTLSAGLSREETLNSLTRYGEASDFHSVGMVDPDGVFYGPEGEKRDLDKFDDLRQAMDADHTLITDPYRSSISGVHIITVFVPVIQDGVYYGLVYANLNLQKIADYAAKNDISVPTRICMINSKSQNYIACSDMNDVPAGSWNSLLLKQEDMVFENDGTYSEFVSSLADGIREGTLSYGLNQKDYTLGYVRIERMPNWYLAVIIANEDLSGVLTYFMGSMYHYMGLLLVTTVVFACVLVITELVQRMNFQKLATLDIMTGIYNKRTFENLVRDYIVTAVNRKRGYLIFVDVDDFKKYNDKYGHLSGDIVLKEFAKCLKDAFDSMGYVGRYGGDEFVVFVTANCEKSVISDKIKAIKEKLSYIEIEGTGKVAASFSAGGACFPADGMDFEELCSAADQALYQVKEAGKGKFYWWR